MDAPGALGFSHQLPAGCHLPNSHSQATLPVPPVEISWGFVFFSFFPSGFLLEHFCVCLMHRGPRANNISKTFCHNSESQNN